MDLVNYDFTSNLHCFEQNGFKIVLDVNSGSLHTFDDLSWAALMALIEGKGSWQKAKEALTDKFTEREVLEVFEEFRELYKEGSLFSTDPGPFTPDYPEQPIIKAICLHVAHDCNLRCEYCFAGTGDFGGDRSLMDIEVGKQAIRFVIEKSGHRRNCEVDFFGGEPLVNYKVVKELVEFGKKEAAKAGKSIKFTLTTNAVLLNKQVQNFLEANDISVVLSLDGRKEVNDRMRPFAGGAGSYETVAKNIKSFLGDKPAASPYAVGTYYYVRGTYTGHNLDFDQDVIHMAEMGCKQISMEPVVSSPEDHYSFKEGDFPAISEAYDRLAEKYLSLRNSPDAFNFFHFNLELGKGPCLPKRLSGCGAGHEYLAVSPDGTLYPCHQFVGKEEFRVGDVFSGDIDLEMAQRFRSAHVYNKPECTKCWARFFCSGGCHAAAYNFNKDITKPYTFGCSLQRKRLESAMYIKVREAIE